jgi:hypothetical protein
LRNAVGARGYRNAVILPTLTHTETIEHVSLRTPMRNRRAFLKLEGATAQSLLDAQLSAPAFYLPTPRATG